MRAFTARATHERLPQFLAHGMGKRDVGHDAPAKECVLGGFLGAVNKLIHKHDVALAIAILKRADGADADDPRHAELLHRPDVGAMIQLAGKQMMTAPVSRQEHHFAPGDFARQQFIRRLSKRRVHLDPLLSGQRFDLIKPAAADDADTLWRWSGDGWLALGLPFQFCFSSWCVEIEP